MRRRGRIGSAPVSHANALAYHDTNTVAIIDANDPKRDDSRYRSSDKCADAFGRGLHRQRLAAAIERERQYDNCRDNDNGCTSRNPRAQPAPLVHRVVKSDNLPL